MLEQGLRDEEAFRAAVARMYGRQFAGVLLVLAQAMRLAGSASLAWRLAVRDPRAGVTTERVAGWLGDPWAYDQAVRAANTVLEAYRPEGEIEPPEIKENPEADTALYELERNPGPSWAAGVLYQVARLPPGEREAWVDEVRDLLGDLADADVNEPPK